MRHRWTAVLRWWTGIPQESYELERRSSLRFACPLHPVARHNWVSMFF